jgi:hypothetical protein
MFHKLAIIDHNLKRTPAADPALVTSSATKGTHTDHRGRQPRLHPLLLLGLAGVAARAVPGPPRAGYDAESESE